MRRSNLLFLLLSLFALSSLASTSFAQTSPGLNGGNIVIVAPPVDGPGTPGLSLVQRAGGVDLSAARRWLVSMRPQTARQLPSASLKSRQMSFKRNPFRVP